jgi:hypothetical protein
MEEEVGGRAEDLSMLYFWRGPDSERVSSEKQSSDWRFDSHGCVRRARVCVCVVSWSTFQSWAGGLGGGLGVVGGDRWSVLFGCGFGSSVVLDRLALKIGPRLVGTFGGRWERKRVGGEKKIEAAWSVCGYLLHLPPVDDRAAQGGGGS